MFLEKKKYFFFEIFFKSIKIKKFKSPLILICDKKILDKEIKNINFNKNIEQIKIKNIYKKKIKKKKFI